MTISVSVRAAVIAAIENGGMDREWLRELTPELHTIHNRNEFLLVNRIDQEREDFWRMKAILSHPEKSVRDFYKTYTE